MGPGEGRSIYEETWNDPRKVDIGSLAFGNREFLGIGKNSNVLRLISSITVNAPKYGIITLIS